MVNNTIPRINTSREPVTLREHIIQTSRVAEEHDHYVQQEPITIIKTTHPKIKKGCLPPGSLQGNDGGMYMTRGVKRNNDQVEKEKNDRGYVTNVHQVENDTTIRAMHISMRH